ncbi:versican core protein-like isoform X1 [Huso huso]|uniref:Versican core protein-like isoform X1 n=1 Tax=Huso huso TaxID=61971 RepID=A0ABR0ZZZ0_HUSHU
MLLIFFIIQTVFHSGFSEVPSCEYYLNKRVAGVFHYDHHSRYSLTFWEAKAVCQRNFGATMADRQQMYTAYKAGLEECRAGWISSGEVAYPRVRQHWRCGQNQTGVITYGIRKSLLEKWDVFCHKDDNDCSVYRILFPNTQTPKEVKTEENGVLKTNDFNASFTASDDLKYVSVAATNLQNNHIVQDTEQFDQILIDAAPLNDFIEKTVPTEGPTGTTRGKDGTLHFPTIFDENQELRFDSHTLTEVPLLSTENYSTTSEVEGITEEYSIETNKKQTKDSSSLTQHHLASPEVIITSTQQSLNNPAEKVDGKALNNFFANTITSQVTDVLSLSTRISDASYKSYAELTQTQTNYTLSTSTREDVLQRTKTPYSNNFTSMTDTSTLNSTAAPESKTTLFTTQHTEAATTFSTSERFDNQSSLKIKGRGVQNSVNKVLPSTNVSKSEDHNLRLLQKGTAAYSTSILPNLPTKKEFSLNNSSHPNTFNPTFTSQDIQSSNKVHLKGSPATQTTEINALPAYGSVTAVFKSVLATTVSSDHQPLKLNTEMAENKEQESVVHLPVDFTDSASNMSMKYNESIRNTQSYVSTTVSDTRQLTEFTTFAKRFLFKPVEPTESSFFYLATAKPKHIEGSADSHTGYAISISENQEIGNSEQTGNTMDKAKIKINASGKISKNNEMKPGLTTENSEVEELVTPSWQQVPTTTSFNSRDSNDQILYKDGTQASFMSKQNAENTLAADKRVDSSTSTPGDRRPTLKAAQGASHNETFSSAHHGLYAHTQESPMPVSDHFQEVPEDRETLQSSSTVVGDHSSNMATSTSLKAFHNNLFKFNKGIEITLSITKPFTAIAHNESTTSNAQNSPGPVSEHTGTGSVSPSPLFNNRAIASKDGEALYKIHKDHMSLSKDNTSAIVQDEVIVRSLNHYKQTSSAISSDTPTKNPELDDQSVISRPRYIEQQEFALTHGSFLPKLSSQEILDGKTAQNISTVRSREDSKPDASTLNVVKKGNISLETIVKRLDAVNNNTEHIQLSTHWDRTPITTVPVITEGSSLLSEESATKRSHKGNNEFQAGNDELNYGGESSTMKPTRTTLDQRDFTAELEETITETITESNSESLQATPSSSPTGAFPEPCSSQPETVTASPMTDGSTITHVPTSMPSSNVQSASCGGVLRGVMGEFQSPGFPQSYLSDMDCTWVIEAPVGHIVHLDFHSLVLEEHRTCQYDYVIVYDGRGAAKQELGRFCGSELPPQLRATSNAMMVVMKSDSSVELDGFSAQFSTVKSLAVLTGQISLRGGRNRFEGLVEVEYGGHQGGICAKQWDNRNAAVVCRQLGFSGMAWATSRIKLREGDLPVSVSYVKCSGDETSLDGCEVKRGVECGTTERAGVHCQVLESCSALRNAGVLESGTYVIDPDGEELGVDPFAVQCDMDIEPATGVTVVGHDSEGRLRVAPCEEAGCYSRHIIYNQASIDQLRALTEVSESCEQFVRLECRHIRFLQEGWGWWVSRDGKKVNSWGGAITDSGKCGCGVRGDCDRGLSTCNCDANDEVWRSDEGLLTDASSLPVQEVRFGDTRDIPVEMAFHRIGKLRCRGQKNRVPVLESCAALKEEGFAESGRYVIDPDGVGQGVFQFEVYCDMTSNPTTGITVVSHDSESRMRVAPCEEQGCYGRELKYEADLIQINALTRVSKSCQQYVKLDCRHIRFIQSGWGWWVSWNGQKMFHWGGAEINSSSCACGMTGTCSGPARLCNCDSNDHIWRTDEGYLRGKSLLPVKSVHFGDTQDAPLEMAFHTIGKLTCKGKASCKRL